MQLEETLRRMIRRHGSIPLTKDRRGVRVMPCPACGIAFPVQQGQIGAETTAHTCPRCPGTRFHIDGQLRGFLIEGRRVGTEEYERGR